MAYVGNSPNYQNFATDTFDGGGASHTLTYTPGSAAALLVFVDGVHQKPTTDYTVSGTTLTPTTAWPSGTGNVVVVYLGRSADVGTPSDGTVSAAKLATTSITGQTEDTSPDMNADYILTYDNSGAVLKKVLLGRTGPVSGTMQATASGTSIDFTSIPSWVKRITVNFVAFSTNGTSVPIIQIGDSGGIEATGYSSTASSFGAGVSTVDFTTGFAIADTWSATQISHCSFVLTLQDASTNTWVCFGGGRRVAAGTLMGGGSKALSATLDRVRITMVNGTDAFDAGSVNILYE